MLKEGKYKQVAKETQTPIGATSHPVKYLR
jgi:hypothetical protein